MRLEWHLLRLVLAALLPLVALSAVLLASALRDAQANRERAMIDVARAVSHAVDTEIERSITALRILGHSNSLARGDMTAFRARAESTRLALGNWANVLLVESDGTPVLNLGIPAGQPVPPLADADLAKEVARSGRPEVSGFIMGAMSKRPLVAVAVPVAGSGGALRVLQAVIYSSEWTNWLQRRIPEGWTAAIDDRDGYVIGRSADPERFVGRRASEGVRKPYSERTEGITRIVSLAGDEVYIAFHTSALTEWHVVVFVPTAVANAGAMRLGTALGAVFVGVIALGIVLALLTARPLASGIKAMSGAIASLGRGERIPPFTSSVAELAETGQAAARAAELLAQRTERVASLQTELAQRAEGAERANRAKDRFLAMLSHELRTPLAAITNAAAVLVRLGLPSEAARMSAVVQRQAAHLSSMVDDLLDVSRVVANKIELRCRPVDMGDLAARTVAELQAAGRLTAHRIELCAEHAIVNGDADRLLQVVRNLVDNAIKYTPAGGRVDLTVSREPCHAVLSVRDTGAGIDPELAANLFEPFVQGAQPVDRPSGGLGLGLSIVRGLVVAHGGTVQARTRGYEQGTEFIVRLPLAPDAKSAPDAAAPAPPRRLRVAVIEDHGDTRASMRALLEHDGHEVLEAEDGDAGLALLLEQRPDVAFVDLGLPRRDGFDVASAARAAGIATRLFALTGYAERAHFAGAAEAAFDAVLIKPATPESIRAAIVQRAPAAA